MASSAPSSAARTILTASYTTQLSDSATGQTAEVTGDGELGVDPDTGETVYLKSGRFGPYVQLGDGKDAKRSGLPKGWEPADH